MDTPLPIRTALLSVYDKTNLQPFAQHLHDLGVKLYASGGTFAYLQQAHIPAEPLEHLTGFTELLDGRVKTLHPKIHAGILADRNRSEHRKQLEERDIPLFDMVVVNFYPFHQAVEQQLAIEQSLALIDIGGPALLRAAAKNFPWVVPVSSPGHYDRILEELRSTGGISRSLRQELAASAFATTAAYDALIAQYLTDQADLPPRFVLSVPDKISLRYGENPHQQAALYTDPDLTYFQQLHGKALSYNNLLDMDAAVRLILEFDQPTAAIIKHTNPCGVASAPTIEAAYRKALATDRTSAFGGIVICNRPVDPLLADALNEIFLEVILAPDFDDTALEILKRKKNRRLIRWDPQRARQLLTQHRDIRAILGGYLVQTRDVLSWNPDQLQVVTHRRPTDEEWTALEFGWKVVKHIRSNAIVFTFTDRTAAIGAGQMSRIDALRCAVLKAKNQDIDLQGTILASDAFFPFPDSIEKAAEAGATAIIQPGGSVRDPEVIEAANRHNLAMVFTGIRHFQH